MSTLAYNLVNSIIIKNAINLNITNNISSWHSMYNITSIKESRWPPPSLKHKTVYRCDSMFYFISSCISVTNHGAFCLTFSLMMFPPNPINPSWKHTQEWKMDKTKIKLEEGVIIAIVNSNNEYLKKAWSIITIVNSNNERTTCLWQQIKTWLQNAIIIGVHTAV